MVTALVFTLPTGTAGPKDKLYPWERKHKSPATTTDAVLCYGASHHRNPFLWDKGRFAPYVTYVDPDGKEQWLFDGFIFLESQDVDRPDSGAYSYMTGVLRDAGVSAGKEQWQELIDSISQRATVPTPWNRPSRRPPHGWAKRPANAA